MILQKAVHLDYHFQDVISICFQDKFKFRINNCVHSKSNCVSYATIACVDSLDPQNLDCHNRVKQMRDLFLHTNSRCTTCCVMFLPQFYILYKQARKNIQCWLDLNATQIWPGFDYLSLLFGPNISPFTYQRTNIWKLLIRNTSYCIQNRNPYCNDCTSILPLFYNLQSIMQHLVVFKRKHWKYISKVFINNLEEFVVHDIYRWNKHKRIRNYTTKCLYMVLSIILIYMHHLGKINKQSCGKYLWFKLTLNEDSITPVYFEQHKIKAIDQEAYICYLNERNKIAWLFENCLKPDISPYYQQLIQKNALVAWKQFKSNQICLRSGCKVLRKYSAKWYKCSACLVALYCSKRCGKLDWNNGHHKQFCSKYVNLYKTS
eukprot:462268_1